MNICFDTRDIAILNNSTSRLNDVCINGGAALLQEYFSLPAHPACSHAQRCALLSTHDLVRVRYKADDADLWRNTYRSSFWLKDIWIIPIHRHSEAHWVLGVACLQTQELFLFDSLSGRRAWRQDVKVCDPLFMVLCDCTSSI